MEELPQPVDVGSGKCSSTITEPGGCGATIKSREEILQLKKNKKKKWSGVKQGKNMLKTPSPIDPKFYICPRCYKQENTRVKAKASSSEIVSSPSGSSSSVSLLQLKVMRNKEHAINHLFNEILNKNEKLRQKAKVSKKKLSSLKSYKAQATRREKKKIKKNKTKDNGITALWKSIMPENGGTLFKYNKAIREAILIIIEVAPL
eukprot:g1212.t1